MINQIQDELYNDEYADVELSETEEFSDEEVEEVEEAKDTYSQKANFKKILKFFKHYWAYLLVFTVYLATLFRFIYDIYSLATSVVLLDYTYVNADWLYILLSLAVPMAAWFFSTAFKKMSYTYIRLGSLIFCFANAAVLFCLVLYRLNWYTVVNLLLTIIPATVEVNSHMIVSLCQFASVLVPVVLSVIFLHEAITTSILTEVKNDIIGYKANRNLDLRRYKKYKYDMTIARSKKTGKRYRVKQEFRNQHCMVCGATGAGKTSMVYNPAIANDFDQLIYNTNELKKQMKLMLESGKVVLNSPLDDDDFSLSAFSSVTKKAKQKMDKLAKKIPLCGVTVVAPNSGFADDIYELAVNRGFKKINRIDPELDEYGRKKSHWKGLNPLYIKPGLPHDEFHRQIISKSRVFADVLQDLFDNGGGGNIYFTGLNKQFTSSIIQIQMRTIESLHQKNPYKYKKPYITPMNFYNAINNFDNMQDYSDEMELYLKEHPEDEENYRNILTQIQRDILGPGAKQMVEQIRGLVNQVSNLLANPLVREILCTDDTVDFDEALATNQITLVNYSLALGDSDSRALGLFVLMLFQTAVFRRPKKARSIHFVYIDEYPELLHPKMAKASAIFRQYNVCLHTALQAFSQFDKFPETSFMKNVMLSNSSTQIIFGRTGPEEMEYYQKLAGKLNRVVSQSAVSQSALSDENTSLSYSERSSVQLEDAITARDIRFKDFAEGNMITVDDGNPVDMFPVVLDFLTEKQKLGLKAIKVDWSSYYKAAGAEDFVQEQKVTAKKNSTDGPVSKFVKDSAKINLNLSELSSDAAVSTDEFSVGANVNSDTFNAKPDTDTSDSGEPIGSNDTHNNAEPSKQSESTADAFSDFDFGMGQLGDLIKGGR